MHDRRAGDTLPLGKVERKLAELADAGCCGTLGSSGRIGEHVDCRCVQELVDKNIAQAPTIVLVEVENDGVGFRVIQSCETIIHLHHNQINGADEVPGSGEQDVGHKAQVGRAGFAKHLERVYHAFGVAFH